VSSVYGVAVDHAGNVVIADSNERLRVVAESTGTFYGKAMTAADICTIAGNGHEGFSGDGGPATSAELNGPEGLAIDGTGNVVIADTSNDQVRVVAVRSGTFYGQAMTAGDIYTVAGSASGGFGGDGGPATSAKLSVAAAVTVDGAGNLVIADSGNVRVRVVALRSGTFYGQAMTQGDIYTVAGNGTSGGSGNGGTATAAELRGPEGVAFDTSGNLVIADGNDVKVVAESNGTFYGKAMTAGHMYKAAGVPIASSGSSGNGGKAINAELDIPGGLAVTGAGDYLIAEFAQARIVPAASGTYFGDAMVAGDIYAVAGTDVAGYSGDKGPATTARVRYPDGVTLDSSGNVIIPDTGNNRVRVVAASSGTFYGQAMTAGDIYTIAGDGTAGFGGDGAPATSAELKNPLAVAIDGAGNVAIADEANFRVRVVAESPGTFYGQSMTAGDIYTVAGNGTYGESGDGGPPTAAKLAGPVALGVDGAANLVILDQQMGRVRVVSG
jgi:trimeric autotransporter adhesin